MFDFESHSPLQKKGIKLAKGGGFPLITPCEPSILQVEFLELAALQHGLQTIDSTSVDIALVLVSCPMNLVEITRSEPHQPARGFLGEKLGKESVLREDVVGPYTEVILKFTSESLMCTIADKQWVVVVKLDTSTI